MLLSLSQDSIRCGLDGLSEISKELKIELIKKKGKFILEIGFDQK